jgi:predicted dehydrogenase/threonine dehydrogenase-like Zn-dependent dehydrogenase
MKQLIQSNRGEGVQVADVPTPLLSAGGVLVATQSSLISAGTERSSARVANKSLLGKALERPDLVQKVLTQVRHRGVLDTARAVFNRLDTPTAPGYSCSGIALEVGQEVAGIKPGDRVACAGQNHASHAEMVFVPKNLCVPIPAGVDFDAAAYVALGAIALQGIRQAEPRIGEVVAVVGLGLLGQLSVQLLRANGCAVVAADLEPGRLELARKSGVRAVLPVELSAAVAAASAGAGADAVIITASADNDGPVTLAAEVCRKRGRVVVVGAVGMDLPREPFYLKELDLRLSTSYGPGRYDPNYEARGVDYPLPYVRWTEQRNMSAFLALLADGKLDVGQLTTHRFPIERAAQAYELILGGEQPHLGVLLQYPRSTPERATRTVTLQRRPPVAQVRLGLIGAGNHVSDMLVPQLARRRDVEIRAVCTPSGMKARASGERLKAAYCTSDCGALLEDAAVNAVLIGSRHDSHARLVIAALGAGKHVFVEKPLCLTEQELNAVLEAYADAARDGLHLMVGFNRRYSPHAREIRAAFAERANPLVMSYRVNAGAVEPGHWIQDAAAGGGRIVGEGCHFVDFMQYVCGATVAAVQAAAIGRHASGITSDQATVTLEFTDGSIGTLLYAAGGHHAVAKERFEAFGNGTAVIMDDLRTTQISGARGRRRFRTRGQDKGFAAEMAAFCAAVRGESSALPAITEIESVTRACCLAARSLASRERYTIELTTAPPRP